MNLSLPTDFHISFKITGTNAGVWLELGNSSSNSALIGQTGSDGTCSFRVYTSGSNYNDHKTSNVVSGQTSLITAEKSGNNYSFDNNGSKITFTESVTHQLLKRIFMNSSSFNLRELKIKPL